MEESGMQSHQECSTRRKRDVQTESDAHLSQRTITSATPVQAVSLLVSQVQQDSAGLEQRHVAILHSRHLWQGNAMDSTMSAQSCG